MSSNSEQFSVTVSPKGSAGFAGQPAAPAVVWMTGEHDVSNASRLSHVIAETIALDEEDVVVDLGGVTFLSAATIAIFARANAFLNARSRSLVLRSPRRSAIRLLGICGLAHLISPPPLDSVVTRIDAQGLRTWVAVPTEPRAAKIDTSARATAPPTVRADVSTAAERLVALNEKVTPGSAD